MLEFLIYFLFEIIYLIIPLLIIVAFFTVFERKVMAIAQRRQGPNVVGLDGFLQAFADGFKLFLKEIIIPFSSNYYVFLLGPFLTFFLSLLNWILIPFYPLNNYIIPYSLLYIYVVSSLSIYGIILSGWSSNSKYSLLGALRSTAQMISYELLIGFIFLILCIFTNSLNLVDFILIQKEKFLIFPLLPIFFIFLIVILAETNRHPFDLPEAEAELVSGYNTEYSSIKFAFFFLGEYANMFLMAVLTVIFFLGGWYSFIFFLKDISFLFSLKILLIMFFFIWARILLPRYRYDQLMRICWKIFLPLLFGFFIFYLNFLKIFNGFIISTENIINLFF